MILSILDTDLYKFSTSNAYFHLYPLAEGTFKFNDRAAEVYDAAFLSALKEEFEHLGRLRLTDAEFDYITRKIRYINRNYWEWLRGFHFDPSKIDVSLDKDGHLQIEVTDYLYKVTLYEVPILAIVAELRNRVRGVQADIHKSLEILDAKIELANAEGLSFSEFGTRRRFSSVLHDAIVKELKEKCPKYCAGTSNVYFAMKYDMTPIGTFPHEWVMFHSGVFGYKRANYLSLEDWIKVYDGALSGIREMYGTTRTLDLELQTEVQVAPIPHVTISRPENSNSRKWQLQFDHHAVAVQELMGFLLATYPVRDLNISEPEIESIIRNIYGGRQPE